MSGERTIYLIRHGAPELPGEESRCLGRLDVPLSEKGKRQAEALGGWLSHRRPDALYASPLTRCRETAAAIGAACGLEAVLRADLRELDAGTWEGLTFSEIRRIDPEGYRRRGEDLADAAPPGGESFRRAGERFRAGMETILRESRGDAAVVAHAGVIRAYLCLLEGRPLGEVLDIPQPCGGITVLRTEGERLTPVRVGWKPSSFLDEAAREELYRRFGTPEEVRRHMAAVASFLDALLDRLDNAPDFDRDRLRRAALVHDVARTRKRHAEAAADALRREGYEDIAALVRVHQSPIPTDPERLSEADLLFYADKRRLGERPVTVEERFAASRAKCVTPEALEKHRALEKKTLLIQRKIQAHSQNDPDRI